MANNKLDNEIGRQFVDMLRINETLIDFEFGFNNFCVEDVSLLYSDSDLVFFCEDQ